MVLKAPLRNFFPNYKATLKLVPTRMPLRKLASPERLFRTKSLQFIVDKSMNKITFREYVQKLYGLEVDSVGSVNLPGKTSRNTIQRGVKRRPDYKKMFIRLRNWVDVPFAPRAREEYEHAINPKQDDYAANFRRTRPTLEQKKRFWAREKREKNRFDPEDDPARKPRRVIQVPRRIRED